MKGRSTLTILISIVLLGTFIWFQESWRTKNSAKQIERIRMFNLDENTLTSIEMDLTNGVVRCVKENGIWMAGDKEGNMGRADIAHIHRMVSGLNSMGKGTAITGKELAIRGLDAAEYGFANPLATITAVDNTGRRTWMVGRKAPLGDMVYAKNADDETIYTLPGKLLMVIPDSYDILRDRVLFPGDDAGVRRVEIRGSGGFVQLVKDPQVGWRLQQPVAAKADSGEIESFVEKLYGFYIEDFIADNVSDFSVYGLQGEPRQISIGSGDGSSRMLIIGDEVPDNPDHVYARRADDTSVFTLPIEIQELLMMPSERFRDVDVISIPANQISSINISREGEGLTLTKDDSKAWNVTTPVVWEAEERAVADLLTLWEHAVITDFNIMSNTVAPEWVFEFGSAETGVTNIIEILPSLGSLDGLLIKRDGGSDLYQINLPSMPHSVINPLVYKDRQVWQLKKEDVEKLTLLTDGPTREIVERQENRSFALVETNGNFRADEQACDQLVSQLEDVETSGYITYNPRDLEIYGLENPSVELHVGLSGSNELGRVLLIGRETPDGFYSMVKGRDVIFYLEKGLVGRLSTKLTEVPEGTSPDPE